MNSKLNKNINEKALQPNAKLFTRPLMLDEVSKAVSLHMDSFPSFFLTFLGEPFLKILYRFYIQGSTEIALAGEHNGQIVALLLGTTQPRGFYRRLATKHFYLFALACFKPVIQRPAIVPRLIRALFYRGDCPDIEDSVALLASICVDPDFQRMDIGQKLLIAFEYELWKKGTGSVYLVTDRYDNESVLKFYKKNGWNIDTEYYSPEGRALRRYMKSVSSTVLASNTFSKRKDKYI